MGAGAGGRDRRGHRAGRRPAADRRQERDVPARVRQLLRPRARSSTAAARRACSGRCCLRARWCRSTRSRSSCSPRRRSTACRCRPSSPAQSTAPATLHARVVRAHARAAARRRDRARRRRSTSSASSPRSRASRCPSGDIASRLGGFDDIAAMEASTQAAARATDAELIELLLGSKNDAAQQLPGLPGVPRPGGKIGLQHDPLLYGAYLLNPFLVRVELVPMLVVNQGEVAVIKAFVGLPTLDTSGAEFKFGSIVRPGHRGIWQEPLRTGKYPINPRVLRGRDRADVDPHAQLGRRDVSEAHNLDAHARRRSRARAARASCSRSTCRCRSTCPTPRRRR